MELSDSEIAVACQQGDRVAQRQLYETTHEQVYRLVARMVGQHDAADVTQQAYLQAFCKIGQFTGRSQLRTWLYRVAVNEALQHLRRKRRRAAPPLEIEPMDVSTNHERAADLHDALEAALAVIDPELRTVFLLREVDGLSYGQIADVVDLPEGTVASRLNRARRELQFRMSQSGWAPQR